MGRRKEETGRNKKLGEERTKKVSIGCTLIATRVIGGGGRRKEGNKQEEGKDANEEEEEEGRS